MSAEICGAEQLEQLTPEEQDKFVLQREWVLGSSYIRSKRKVSRRRGSKIRRTMWEPEVPSRRDMRRVHVERD